MISSCYLNYKGRRTKVDSCDSNLSKFMVDISICYDYFYLEFIFKTPITKIRDHRYRWCPIKKEVITSSFSPLVLHLQSGMYVQANRNLGYWRVNCKKPNVLIWEFNPEYSRPLTQYQPPHNLKQISNSNLKDNLDEIGLLFSTHGGVELSRSKIPFTGVICFTDHCDFDNGLNLETQRVFFKKHGIKVTKGFFLNDFSNRINASWEQDREELEAWNDDGHELAYHSLSQSIKTNEESFNDFKSFQIPKTKVKVWIDHGFQPYNHSLYQAFELDDETYASILNGNNIKTLWNYIDTGTSTAGVINQLNPFHFTLKQYWAGVKKEGLKQGAARLFKAIFFNYLNNDRYIFKYKQLAQEVKSLIYQKKWRSIFKIIRLSFSLAGLIFKLLFNWSKIKNKVFPLARYTPLYFTHHIGGFNFKVFQTLEMIDFKYGLSKSNLDILIDESGVCIGHTYFSVPLKYHTGKLLDCDEQINKTVAVNFEYLSNLIKTEKIWNPTLSDLLLHLESLDKCEFDIDDKGFIYIKNPEGLIFRTTTV